MDKCQKELKIQVKMVSSNMGTPSKTQGHLPLKRWTLGLPNIIKKWHNTKKIAYQILKLSKVKISVFYVKNGVSKGFKRCQNMLKIAKFYKRCIK